MPSIGFRNSMATGTTVASVFLGSTYENAPFDCTIEVGIFSSVNLVTCSLFSGSDVLAEPGYPVAFGAAEAAPVYPDHFPFEDEAAQGDKLKLTLVNANAGTALVNSVLRITPA